MPVRDSGLERRACTRGFPPHWHSCARRTVPRPAPEAAHGPPRLRAARRARARLAPNGRACRAALRVSAAGSCRCVEERHWPRPIAVRSTRRRLRARAVPCRAWAAHARPVAHRPRRARPRAHRAERPSPRRGRSSRVRRVASIMSIFDRAFMNLIPCLARIAAKRERCPSSRKGSGEAALLRAARLSAVQRMRSFSAAFTAGLACKAPST